MFTPSVRIRKKQKINSQNRSIDLKMQANQKQLLNVKSIFANETKDKRQQKKIKKKLKVVTTNTAKTKS